MNYELYIARKLFFRHNKEKDNQRAISHTNINLAIGGIAVCLIVMIIALGVGIGFKQEVRNKIIGFGSHIQISASFSNQTYETLPIQFTPQLIHAIKKTPHVQHVQLFATQPGIMKVGDDFKGVVLKGVDSKYDWTFFKKNLIEGNVIELNDTSFCNKILISKKTADQLHLKIDDKLHIYFVVGEKVRVRPFTVSGIYSTGFSDYDQLFVVGDIRHVRKLNQWENDQCSGMEIMVNKFEDIDVAMTQLYPTVGNRFDKNGNYYMMKSIKETNPQIFSWLDLLDMNVLIIFILMIAVAGVTMISGLLILILDRTNMIGILKSMGANNTSVQKLFLFISLFIVSKGMIIGNVIALILYFVQKQFNIIQLDPQIYYLNTVPIELNVTNVLLINIGVLSLSVFILWLSTYIITKISPIKAIRFE